MSSILEIKEAQKELDRLIEEYHEENPPCHNEDCNFHNKNASGGCTWSHLLEDCREYSFN